jgi:sensor domain CHASE-containing protein
MTFYIRPAFTSGLALRIKGAAYFTKSQLSETDNKDHKNLVAEYNAIDSVVKTKIDQNDHTTSFNSTWDDLKGRFEALRLLGEPGNSVPEYDLC